MAERINFLLKLLSLSKERQKQYIYNDSKNNVENKSISILHISENNLQYYPIQDWPIYNSKTFFVEL